MDSSDERQATLRHLRHYAKWHKYRKYRKTSIYGTFGTEMPHGTLAQVAQTYATGYST